MQAAVNETDNQDVVSFPVNSKTIYGVQSPDGNEMMAEISGYDLNVSFNMRLINSLADAESVANGIADVFYQALMQQLLSMGKTNQNV